MERSELEEIMRLVDLSVVLCVRSCVRRFVVGRDMHSDERLLVINAVWLSNDNHCHGPASIPV